MPQRTKQLEHPLCHPDKRPYAHGLCRKCADSIRWGGKLKNLPTSLSAEARAMAEETAGKVPRYKKNSERAAHFRTSRESVSNFVAGVAVKNALDMERTVQELRLEFPPARAAMIADKLEHDANVQRAIQKTLEKRGLDEKSKQHYVALLWRYAESEKPDDEKRQLQSLRILGRAFIADKVEVDKPVDLPIKNLDEGLKRMGLDAKSLARLGPVSSSTMMDDDEDDGEKLGLECVKSL
jgi:hypothetical protein